MLQTNEIIEFFKLNNTHAKKEFGQNFLISQEKRDLIVDALSIKKDDKILEIGPGLGALTEAINEKCDNFTVVEIDKKYADFIERSFPNITIINKNIVKIKERNFNKIISNLPYYMTSEIIQFIALNFEETTDCVYMMQKECFKRITAKSGNDYNVLNILLDYIYDIKLVTNVGRDCYFPKPDVDSIVAKFTKKQIIDQGLAGFLFKIASLSFKNRRKTLLNNLKGTYDVETITNFLLSKKYSVSVRAEALSVNDFIELATLLRK